jgi:hypothetical protein
MRPKVFLLSIAAAVVLVGALLALKSLKQNPEAPATEPGPAVESVTPTNNPAVAVPVGGDTNKTPEINEQLRLADVQKELERIGELQTDGAGSHDAMLLLLDKVRHREPEVRKAALDGLVQLNDTNAVPGLQEAAALAQDPREKVAILNAIDYLNLPSVTPETQPPIDASPKKVRPPTAPRPGGVSRRSQPGTGKQSGKAQPAPVPQPANPPPQ